ncbi:Pr6Pr family membrane protein [Streptomyces antibioticus]|uniref:Pr6Pr family membrane protein n=1 Tax=Streptomyces antibioticus TaxID=1890 RepID=UPI0036CC20E3
MTAPIPPVPPMPRDIPELPAIPRTHRLLPSTVPAAAVVPPVRRPLAAILRVLIAGTAAAGVAFELRLDSAPRVLSHFAIQADILLAVVMLLSARRAWTASKPLPAALTGAALLYVTIVPLIHHVLHTTTASLLVHTVTPVAALLEWLLLTSPGRLRLRHAATWMAYPCAYLLFLLIRAELMTPGTPAHPLYPFLDPAAHGYRHTLTNALLLGLSFYALAVLLVALDHARPNPIHHRPKTGFRLQPPVG